MSECRLLSVPEILTIVRDGCAHPDNRNIPGGLNTDYFVKRLVKMVEQGQAFVIGMFAPPEIEGAIGFYVVPDIFNGDRVALQNFWFTYPQARGKGRTLLKAYEQEARRLGCKRMMMPYQVQRQKEGFGKFFERYGFSPVEISYVKALACNT